MHPKAWADKKEKKGVEEKGGEKKRKKEEHTHRSRKRGYIYPGLDICAVDQRSDVIIFQMPMQGLLPSHN